LSVGAYIGPALALLLTSALILWLKPLATVVGLVDVPDARKVHSGEIPLIGGLSIFIAVFAADVVAELIVPGQSGAMDYGGFFLAGMLLVLTGMIDDYLDLSATHKMVMQIIAALIMVFSAQVVLQDLGTLGIARDAMSLGIMAVPFTVFATVGVINAINMSDGLDGLAGSLCLVSLCGFFLATALFGTGEDASLLLMLICAVTGFLIFNFRIPGRSAALVFLGDSGSMFLGFALAWFAIRFSQGEDRIMPPAAALWFLMLPLFDAVSMTIRRIMKRRPPFGADREHLHHIFLLAGFTVSETVLILASIALLGVGVGLAATYFEIPDVIVAGGFAVLGLMYLRMIVKSWEVLRFLRYSINRRTGIKDRRVLPDRRVNSNVAYFGLERRLGQDRRTDLRRGEDGDSDVPVRRSG